MNTQEKERLYLERFIAVYSKFPDGRIEYLDKPDVIVHGAKKIGIEITEFYKTEGRDNSSEQRQEILRKEVIQRAKTQYFSNGKPNIDFHISFEKGHPITDSKALAIQVADIAESLNGKPTGRYQWRVCDHIPEVNGVYINQKAYESPLWMDLTIHEVKVTDLERLREIVKKKEEAARGYAECDELWLLICVNAFNNAQEQEIRIDYGNEPLSKKFEKVILYKTHYEHVVEIPG